VVNDAMVQPIGPRGGPLATQSTFASPCARWAPRGVGGAFRDFSRSDHLRYLGAQRGRPQGLLRDSLARFIGWPPPTRRKRETPSASLPGVLAGIFGHGDGSIHGDVGGPDPWHPWAATDQPAHPSARGAQRTQGGGKVLIDMLRRRSPAVRACAARGRRYEPQ
jgi:hypothetical protein